MCVAPLMEPIPDAPHRTQEEEDIMRQQINSSSQPSKKQAKKNKKRMMMQQMETEVRNHGGVRIVQHGGDPRGPPAF